MFFSNAKLNVILVVFVFIFLNCTNNDSQLRPPKRPANVPENAIWSGGLDGGAFIKIIKKKEDPRQIYRVEIFYDTTGEVWYKGKLSIEPSAKPNFDYNDAEMFSGWDGDTLYLRDGRKLIAADRVE